VTATDELVPYQPTAPAQIKPLVSLAQDPPRDSSPRPLFPQSRSHSQPADRGHHGLGATGFVDPTLPETAVATTRLVRTTQLSLSRG
jgi:hypothetical protein